MLIDIKIGEPPIYPLLSDIDIILLPRTDY